MSKEAFLSDIKNGIARIYDAGSEVTVVHHNDADGLASAAVLEMALSRAGFSVQRIPLERVHPPIVARIHNRFVSTILYADLGGRAAPMISEAHTRAAPTGRGRGLTLILDHHHPQKSSDPDVLNLTTEFYGLSGEMDISAATAAYLFAQVLDKENRDLAYLGVVGALGDSHDRRGRLVGENRQALKEAMAQGQVRVQEVEGRPFDYAHPGLQLKRTVLQVHGTDSARDRQRGEQYILTRFGDDIPMTQFWRAVTTLGAAGFFVGGPALGVRMCLEGPFQEAQQKLKELNQIQQAAYEKVLARLKQEGFQESRHIQWFLVGDDFAPMGVKTIGEFCAEIRDADFTDPEKYIVGFQIMGREIPGLGSFDWSLVKASMRVPPLLEKKIMVDRTMPGLAYLVPEAARQVGGSIDACHDYSAATLISAGREEELISAMNELVEDRERLSAAL